MSVLHDLWRQWKKIAFKIGEIQSRIILSIFYLIILMPLGLLFTYFLDRLKLRRTTPSTWEPIANLKKDLEWMSEQ